MSKITDEYLRLWKDDHVQERARRPMSADEESFEELIDEAIASRADLQVAREALEQIARCGYGIDMSDSSQDAAEYWSGQTLRLRALARSALARIKGTP